MAVIYNDNGFASPILFIYDGQERLLKNRVGVTIANEATMFLYDYNEEDDDTCQIEFQTDDIHLPDNKALQIDSVLFVRWGYITKGNKKILSPKRKIVIRDHSTKYESNRIIHKLEATNSASFIKELQANHIRKNNFIDWLGEIAGDQWKPSISIYSAETIITNDIRPPLIDTKYGDVIVSVDNTARPETLTFFEERIIKGQSKAIHKAIEDELKFAEEGPFFIDGRDDDIHIHNRNFKQTSIRTLTYGREPGNIISFNPKTNIKANDTEIAKVATIDPETKQLNYTTSNYIDLEKFISGEGKDKVPKELDNLQIQSILEEYKKGMAKLMESGNHVDIDSEEWNNNIAFKDGYHVSHYWNEIVNDTRAPVGDLLAIDNVAAPIQYSTGYAIDITAKELFQQEGVQNELEIMLQNDVMEKKHRRIESRINIIGDPILESSKVVTVVGVANVHKGKWYITRVTHKITPQNGYTTDLECIKEPIIIAVEGRYTSNLKTILEDNAKEAAENKKLSLIEETGETITIDKQLFPINKTTEEPVDLNIQKQIQDLTELKFIAPNETEFDPNEIKITLPTSREFTSVKPNTENN